MRRSFVLPIPQDVFSILKDQLWEAQTCSLLKIRPAKKDNKIFIFDRLLDMLRTLFFLDDIVAAELLLVFPFFYLILVLMV
jgi:hypothetical protein